MMRRSVRNHASVARWLLHSRFFTVASTFSTNDAVAPTRSAISQVGPFCPTSPRGPSLAQRRVDVNTILCWKGAIQFCRFHAAVADHEEAAHDIERIKRRLRTTKDYLRAMHRMLRDQSYSQVIYLYEDMQSNKVQIDAAIYTAVMKAYSRMKNHGMVKGMFDQIVAAGVKPDKFLVNTLIFSYYHTSDIEAAFEVFHKMPEYGIPPDPVTYRSLMIVCGKAKDVARARETFNEMREKLEQIDARSVNAMLDVYAENVDTANGEAYLQECKNLIEMMNSMEIKVGAFIYLTMIKLCSKIGKTDEVVTYLQKCLDDDTPLNLAAFDTIFDSLATLELMDEELETHLLSCFSRMQELDLRPSSVTFKHIMEFYETRGDVSKAFGFFAKLEQMGRSADCFSIQLEIIERLLESGAYSREEALTKMASVLDKMKLFGVSLTYSGHLTRFAICRKASDVERAFECWNEYGTGGRVPSVKMAESMVQLTLNHDRVDDAVNLVRFMQKEKEIQPTEGTYEAILAYCAGKSDMKNAKTVLEYMKGAKVQPNEVIRGHIDALQLA